MKKDDTCTNSDSPRPISNRTNIRPAISSDVPIIKTLIAAYPEQLVQDYLPDAEDFFVAVIIHFKLFNFLKAHVSDKRAVRNDNCVLFYQLLLYFWEVFVRINRDYFISRIKHFVRPF